MRRKSLYCIEPSGAVTVQIKALRPKREKLRRQLDGAELDMDALVRARCDLHATGNSSDRVYLDARQQSRDLSVAILMDVSLSTDSWIGGRRILDIEKEALITLATALATCARTHSPFTRLRRASGIMCALQK